MSDAKGFKRCDGYVGHVPQNWINGNFPVCPMCGSIDPYWTLKDKVEMTANRVMFRCKDCGCILSATAADFTGATKSKAFAALTTGGLINAISKKKAGKDVNTVYVKIMDVGDYQLDKSMEGKEIPLEELKERSKAFMMKGRENVSTATAPEEQAENEVEDGISVSYAPSANENAGTEFKVSYASQATTPTYILPVALEKEEYSAPGFLKPFAFIVAFFYLFSLICTLVTDIIVENPYLALNLLSSGCALAGSILLAVGLFQKQKLFGIGCFLLAAPTFFSLIINLTYIGYGYNIAGAVCHNMIFLAAWILIGLYCILKGKGINSTVKLISAIVYGVLAFVLGLLSFKSIGYQFQINTMLGIEVIFNFIRTIFLTMILIFFTPFKKGTK